MACCKIPMKFSKWKANARVVTRRDCIETPPLSPHRLSRLQTEEIHGPRARNSEFEPLSLAESSSHQATHCFTGPRWARRKWGGTSRRLKHLPIYVSFRRHCKVFQERNMTSRGWGHGSAPWFVEQTDNLPSIWIHCFSIFVPAIVRLCVRLCLVLSV